MYRVGKNALRVFIAVFLACYVWSAYTGLMKERSAVLEAATLRSLSQLQTASGRLTRSYHMVESALEDVAADCSLILSQAAHTASYREAIDPLLRLPQVSNVYLINAEGTVLFSDRQQPALSSFMRVDMLQAHKARWQESSLRAPAAQQGNKLLYFGRSIYTSAGEFTGILVAITDSNRISGVRSAFSSSGTEFIALADTAGTILILWENISTDASTSLQDHALLANIPGHVLTSGGTRLETTDTNVIAMTQLDGFPLSLVLVSDLTPGLSGWHNQLLLRSAGVLLVLLMTTVGLLMTERHIQRREEAEQALVRSRERTRLSRLVREVATAATAAYDDEEALDVLLRRLCAYTNFPLAIATLSSGAQQRTLWHVTAPLLSKACPAIEEAMSSEKVRQLSHPLWMPVLQEHAELFSGGDLAGLTCGCIMHFGTLGEGFSLGFFAERCPQDEDLTLEVAEQAGILLTGILKSKQDMQSLRDKAAVYSGTFEQVGIPKLLITPENGTILDANPAAATFYGLHREDLSGMPLAQLDVAGAVSITELLSHSCPSQGRCFTARHKKASGDIRDVELQTGYIPFHDRQVLLVIVTDVTQKLHTEKQLLRSEKLLRSIIMQTSMGVSMLDHNGYVIFANPALAQLAGTTSESLEGTKFTTVIAPPMRKEVEEQLARIVQNKQRQQFEWTIEATSGKQLALLVAAAHVQSQEGATQLALFMADITGRKTLNEMMLQNERMASIGGLTTGVVHQIDGSLRTIIQNCQTVSRNLSPEIPGNIIAAEEAGFELKNLLAYLIDRNVLHLMTDIRESAERIMQVTTSMLHFARPASTGHTLTALHHIAEQSLTYLTNDYGLNKQLVQYNITIKKAYDTNVKPASVLVSQMEQAVLSLLRNAVEAFSAANQHATTLSEKNDPIITIKTSETATHAILAIQDNGPGMSETARRKATEPFFTKGSPDTEMGLGLSLVHSIVVNNHQGQFDIHSEEGKGSTFTIAIPHELPQQ